MKILQVEKPETGKLKGLSDTKKFIIWLCSPADKTMRDL